MLSVLVILDRRIEVELFAAENKPPCLVGSPPRSQWRKAEAQDVKRTSRMSIPSPSTSIRNMNISDGIERAPFPAPAKQITGLVNGVETDVSSVHFADKILITISQGGRLSQWVCTFLSLMLVLFGWLTL